MSFLSLLSPRDFTNTVMKGGKIKRHRNGYQVFSAEEWYRVKSEMSKDSGFSEITREVGKQVPRPALPEQSVLSCTSRCCFTAHLVSSKLGY